MPRFRNTPSRRRQPAPTAKWLVLGLTEARLVAHGQRTTHLLPVKPSHHRKRFHEGQRLTVKAYVGGPTECHVTVTDAQRVQLGRVDYAAVRELGHPYLDAFRVAWVAEHEPDHEGDALERFDRRHAHKEVWLVRFALDRLLPVRFLAQRSEEGYTENAARALRDEPPALYDHEWKQSVEANLDLTHAQWVSLGRLESIAERARLRADRGRDMRRRAA
jgi:hypothetical protein